LQPEIHVSDGKRGMRTALMACLLPGGRPWIDQTDISVLFGSNLRCRRFATDDGSPQIHVAGLDREGDSLSREHKPDGRPSETKPPLVKIITID
jgi:hypothetical protein